MKIILALMMILLSTTAYGQLVKCVSKDGKVEYARDCQPGTTEYQTGIRSGGSAAASSPPPAQRSAVEQEIDYKKRNNEQLAQQQKESQKAELNAKNRSACELARANLRGLEDGLRMPRVDPKTLEITHASEAEREAQLANARATVAQNCKVAE